MPPNADPAGSGRSRGRELLANLALSLAVSLALVVAVEGTARLLERPESRPRAAERWTPGGDDHFYTLKPRALGWPPDEVNADGLRDRAHPETKAEDVWRVAILGDSVTEGFGLAAAEAYPRQLQRQLEAAGERVEVLSVAVQGWSTRQERIAYHRIVRRYAPDQVLLAACLNDVTELALQLRTPPRLLVSLHRHSALVRRVVDAAHREEGRVEELFSGRPPLEPFFDEVSALRAEVASDGAELALVVFPYRFQVEPGAKAPSVQTATLAWCASESLRCLDLLPALRPLGPAAFLDENHLSREGAVASAQAIRALLPRRSLREALRAALLAAPSPASEAALRWLEAGVAPFAAAERALVGEALAATLGATSGFAARARAAAAWALGGRRPDPRSLEALRVALADRSEAVASVAAHALGGLGAGREAEAALLAALADERPAVRWAAADALDRLEPRPAWTAALRSTLHSPDPYVRNFAAWTIGRLGGADAGAARELLRLVAEADDEAAPGLARAARQLGPALDPALPELLDALAGGDAAQRARAARTLGLLSATMAVPALSRALADPDAAVRAHAALALPRIGGAAGAVPALRAALRDDDAWVREEAARALGLVASPDAALTGELVVALRDATPGVRRQAARALGRLAEPRPQVLGALEAATRDEDGQVRLEAQRSLESLRAR